MNQFKPSNTDHFIRYHDLPGKGTPILFIHGLGCASSFDYPQVVSAPVLCERRRILIDLLGSGYSDKPANFDYAIESHALYLQELIEHLELNELILFAHSMGGAVATSLAAQIPEKIKALILSESNLDSGGGFFSRKIAEFVEQEFVESGFNRILSASKLTGNHEWAASLSVCSPVSVHRNAMSLIKGVEPSWRELFYKLESPKTYLFGSDTLPDPDFDELARQGIRVDVVPEAGHSMAWENPLGLAQAILNALPD